MKMNIKYSNDFIIIKSKSIVSSFVYFIANIKSAAECEVQLQAFTQLCVNHFPRLEVSSF